jgi:ferric-dicitrate binding protein FerR (iron transport regulator)
VLNNRFAPLESVNAARELAWRDGQLLVRQKPLRQVLDELMRHSGGHVVWLNDVRANTLVSGSFNLAESESAVNALLTSQGVRATFVTSKLLILR